MSKSMQLNYLSEGIKGRNLRITVVGMGYVGLPSAISFHEAGFPVWGLDNSEEVITSLKAGKSQIMEEMGKTFPSGGDWDIFSKYEDCIPDTDIAIVCVPTPVDNLRKPDLKPVSESLNSIISSRNPDSNLVIILESTVQPGTTRRCIEEALSNSDDDGEGLFIAYCPERISPGEEGFGVGDVSRVIGAETKELAEELSALYASITKGRIFPVSSIEVAEAAKLVENAQRDIDIAFSNELSILMPKMGLDVEEVLAAASTKWNFHRHTPGMGVGGHCIPIDPHYYIDIAKKYGVDSSLSPSARELNYSMPLYNANEVFRLFGGVPDKVLVMGYAYKPNVSDTRETPLKPFITSLAEAGVSQIMVWDPLVGESQLPESVKKINSLTEISSVDCIVIGTAHDDVVNLDWKWLFEISNSSFLYDSRRCLVPEKMEEIGWNFHAIGRPLGAVQ